MRHVHVTMVAIGKEYVLHIMSVCLCVCVCVGACARMCVALGIQHTMHICHLVIYGLSGYTFSHIIS